MNKKVYQKRYAFLLYISVNKCLKILKKLKNTYII